MNESTYVHFRDEDQLPVAAFVTFNDDTVKAAILKEYLSMSWLRYYIGAHVFQMDTAKDPKRYLLKVQTAPEPSTLIWENLRYSTVIT